MAFTFVPDYRFASYADVTADFLRSIGVRALILDVDDTLEPYENPLPGSAVKEWLADLDAAGIRCGIVSNNSEERILKFNEEIYLPVICHARKPFARGVRRMLTALCVRAEEAALLGDQIFTDVWAAKNAGIRAILVPPIRDRRDFLTRIKRLLEKPFLRRYEKRRFKTSKNKGE